MKKIILLIHEDLPIGRRNTLKSQMSNVNIIVTSLNYIRDNGADFNNSQFIIFYGPPLLQNMPDKDLSSCADLIDIDAFSR